MRKNYGPEKEGISVIVPTLNEEGNIRILLEQLNRTFSSWGIDYEIIVVDDSSTDKTREEVRKLARKLPLTLLTKNSRPGKAGSLLRGFREARYPVLAMIDADLQYPPEMIPEMREKIRMGADLVVGCRRRQNREGLRRVLGEAYLFFFGKLFFGLDTDIRSGLKVFKKEVIERFELWPSPWSFDLEFLVKARNAGYLFENLEIDYFPRKRGQSKMDLWNGAWEIGWAALKLKLEGPQVVPFNQRLKKLKGRGFHYKGVEFVYHTNLSPDENAFFNLNFPQKIIILGLLSLFSWGLFLNLHLTLSVLVAALTFLYFSDLLFNLFLIFRSFLRAKEIKISPEEITAVKEEEWPYYTIFCPLYKEWEVLPQFVTAISQLDYPKEKLRVLLLMEENDQRTIEEAVKCRLSSYFQIVIVPHSLPKTKPKALNYGLRFAKGQYAVIYDAEDIPEKDQLKKAYLAFQKANKGTICIQAKLNYYNPHQNTLTKLFTAEYSLWFDLILPGLQSIHAPLPLGGTSNHFRLQDLRKLQGWDPFNVTEDCDLGIRLAKRGFRTEMVDSTTFEEANSNFLNWFRQRSRWVKGYIQTYFIHMRHPQDFTWSLKKPDALIFQLVVGGKVLSMFINPFMWLTTVLYFLFRSWAGAFIESLYPPPVMYAGVFCLLAGNFLYLYYYMIGCAKRNHYSLIKYVFLVPFYWLGMSLAGWKALYEIIRKPHYWAKTIHGFHISNERVVAQAVNIIGRQLVDEKIA